MISNNMLFFLFNLLVPARLHRLFGSASVLDDAEVSKKQPVINVIFVLLPFDSDLFRSGWEHFYLQKSRFCQSCQGLFVQ